MKSKGQEKPDLGRNPWNEELASNRAKYGRGGYANSKKSYSRKDRSGRSKRQQWLEDNDE